MFKHGPIAIEDMAEYWMNEILDCLNEPFNDQDIIHCKLFALLYIGHSLDAIDTRLMNVENLMFGIYEAYCTVNKQELKDEQSNSD